MNEELKEILELFKEYASGGMSGLYPPEETIGHLLNYITNLQQKVDQYENPDDLTLFYMWLDEKAKGKMKQLQEENEKLNNKYNKALELLVDFNLPCDIDDFNTTEGIDYCSRYCSTDDEIFKKCWDKFIEWKLGSDKE